MQFDRIIGVIDPATITAAEKKLTDVFLELGMASDNATLVSKLGGDPLIFSLVVPIQHIATLNIPTAATNGRVIYWNPAWVVSKSYLTARFTAYHESAHALLMHPQRRGNRDWRLWNIAADYIANGWLLEDLAIRVARNNRDKRPLSPEKIKQAVHDLFVKGFGNYCTIKQCQQMFSDPLGPVDGMEKWVPELADPNKVALPSPDTERELTQAEKKTLEQETIKFKLYYADPTLTEEMKRPEKIYDILYQATPRCPECGKLGMYVPPADAKTPSTKEKPTNASQTQDQKPDHQHPSHQPHNHQPSNDSGSGGNGSKEDGSGSGNTDDNSPGDNGSVSKPGGCQTCPGAIDVLDFGSTADTHMDSVEDQDEIAKRVSDAIQTAKAMAGNVPGKLVEELEKLSQPRISFPDVIRSQLSKARNGKTKSDWTKFRSRPLSFGLLVPKKKTMTANAVCLLDTSGSMSKIDIAIGLSQLQGLDERAEITIVPGDCEIYWDDAIKIRRCNAEEISKVKAKGRGGTKYAKFFDLYEKKIGRADFLIIITDGLLDKKDVEAMKDPRVPVYWLITGADKFQAPFGRVFDLLA